MARILGILAHCAIKNLFPHHLLEDVTDIAQVICRDVELRTNRHPPVKLGEELSRLANMLNDFLEDDYVGCS